MYLDYFVLLHSYFGSQRKKAELPLPGNPAISLQLRLFSKLCIQRLVDFVAVSGGYCSVYNFIYNSV
jgi:hypothetical protein